MLDQKLLYTDHTRYSVLLYHAIMYCISLNCITYYTAFCLFVCLLKQN